MLPFDLRSLLKKPGKEPGQSGSPTPSALTGIWGATGATLLAIIVITLAAGGLRLYSTKTFTYSHPDEGIAIAAVNHVFKTHDDDTNWGRTDVYYKSNTINTISRRITCSPRRPKISKGMPLPTWRTRPVSC